VRAHGGRCSGESHG